MGKEARKAAEFLGFDLSTTALSMGVRSAEGEEDFVSIPMRGACKWQGQPAFDLRYLPDLFLEALAALRLRNWVFSQGGALSSSIRQHDMVLLGEDSIPLIPALSWQCNAAVDQVRELREKGVEEMVGRIEERFILPKLMWALKQRPNLDSRICQVMTTGDYIAWMLTGKMALSTSDGLSNGLLKQLDKQLAIDAFGNAGFDLLWFPGPIQSGKRVGSATILNIAQPGSKRVFFGAWRDLIDMLQGWEVYASLGDNHAGGVGCGLADDRTIVVSAGSSGTVIRRCRFDAKTMGLAASFEYYNNKLLLMMLHQCAVWYNRFIKRFGRGKTLEELNELAENSETELQRIVQRKDQGKWQEVYPWQWRSLGLADKAASTQASIALELLLLVKDMLKEVLGVEGTIRRFVITGGLSRSLFFQRVLKAGLSMLAENPKVFVSNRQSPLAAQAATLGAIINAMVGSRFYPSLSDAVKDLCPLRPIGRPPQDQEKHICDFLAPHLFRVRE